MEQKDGISKAVGAKREEGRELRQELTKMKKTVGFASEAEIDARILEIENTLVHNSHTLAAEKALMKEIAELKKSKPKLSQAGWFRSK